jgi:glycosyltransferase involved in cell wall biosynthesis
VASSRCILNHYLRARVDPDRLFLSYYGTDTGRIAPTRTHALRNWLGVDDSQLLVGNISHMYPPKYYLGQMNGLKGHESLIDALAIVTRSRPDVTGALVGGAWNGATRYESRLRSRAFRAAGDRVKMPGPVEGAFAAAAWADFDCVIHTPTSENCGGVIEPLLAGVPTIASTVGGLPEVIIDGITGYAVPPRNAQALAGRVLHVLENPREARGLAAAGRGLVRTMFDVRRTAREIYEVYEHLSIPGRSRPAGFEPALPANGRYALQS